MWYLPQAINCILRTHHVGGLQTHTARYNRPWILRGHFAANARAPQEGAQIRWGGSAHSPRRISYIDKTYQPNGQEKLANSSQVLQTYAWHYFVTTHKISLCAKNSLQTFCWQSSDALQTGNRHFTDWAQMSHNEWCTNSPSQVQNIRVDCACAMVQSTNHICSRCDVPQLPRCTTTSVMYHVFRFHTIQKSGASLCSPQLQTITMDRHRKSQRRLQSV